MKIICLLPQGSRLGPLLFIIYINDITVNIESDILIFADDTSLLVSGKSSQETAKVLNRDLKRIDEWSMKWKVLFNADKSEEIVFSKTNSINNTPLLLNGEQIKQVKNHKHLGIIFSHNLDWSAQVHSVCQKANRKLAVLRSVKMLKRHTLDLLYKLTVRSCIDYALPVYYHSLKVTDRAKLSQIQYTAGKVVCGALHCTSKQKVNTELSWESIEDRAHFLGLSLFHKIAIGCTRPLIRDCLPTRKINPETLRSGSFHQFPYAGEKFSKSFFPFFTKKYNNLPHKVRNLSIEDFKLQLSDQIKPKKHKHYAYSYNKYANVLLTRVRIGYSYLTAHSFTTGHTTTNICPYCLGRKPETSAHYITVCPYFAEMRKILYDQIEQNFIPNFKKLSNKRQYEILVYGYDPDNPELKQINGKIMLLTQTYIMKTKRFK